MTKKTETPGIKELREKYATLVAEKESLLQKKQTVIEKREQNEISIVALISQTKKAEAAVNLAERRRLRDEITQAQLDKIISDCTAATKAMNSADHMRHLALDVIREIDKETAELNDKTAASLRRLCAAIRDELVAELNPGVIREQLLEIYASHAHGGYSDWQKMLIDLFPMPGVEESSKVRAAFADKHKLS